MKRCFLACLAASCLLSSCVLDAHTRIADYGRGFECVQPEGKRWIIFITQSSEGEVHLRFEFEEEVKTVSVITKSYSELKGDTVPVYKRIGFRGELNTA